jgi:flagellin
MVINTTTHALYINRAGKNNTAMGPHHVSAARLLGRNDAIGHAASQKIREQIHGLEMANRNAQDGGSMAQTADSGARQIENLIQRTRDLTIRYANDTNKECDRQKAAQEMVQLLEEVDRLAVRVEFNGKKLLEGSLSFPKSIYLQVGLNERQHITFSIEKLDVEGLGLNALRDTIKTAAAIDLHVSAALSSSPWLNSGAVVASELSALDAALGIISHARDELGALQNRLQLIMTNLDISSENMIASTSRITDILAAKEMINMTITNVLPVYAYQRKRQWIPLFANNN